MIHKLKHIVEQPFVFATGLAALVHSTWSLGTLFSGQQPDAAWNVHFFGWIVPALLIAFALDIGQISTSMEIRERGLTAARGSTFLVFAVATYYLQWLYMAHHMPALALSAGVMDKAWTGLAINLRDAALWVVPALLPLSTILYTFSSNKKAIATTTPVVIEAKELEVVTPISVPLVQPLEVIAPISQNGNGKHAVTAVNGAKKNYRRTHDATDDSAIQDAPPPTE